MDKSRPRFIEMQKQIQCLAKEIKHLKTCITLSNSSDNESTEIAETLRQQLFLPQPPSPGKYVIFQRRENATNFQPSKNSQGASAEGRSVTNK